MATVRLGRYELEEYDLPKVCVCCGGRASHYKSKRFQWSPPWAFFVLGALGAAIFMKSMTVSVPLCARHKWHWGGRTAVILLSLVAVFALLLAGIAAADALDADPPVVAIPFVVLLVAWLVMTIALSATTVRPTEITDKSITLKGVSEEFVEALDEDRRGDDEDRPRRRRSRYDDEDDEDRPRRRRARDDDEDDRPRARRRSADDDGGYYDPDRRSRRGRDDEDDR